ncbi:MAG: TRAP transporter large permease [Atribacterota bacterium]|nr:TRAP transporter large permease [Atribacterota bacterium]
MGLIFISLVTFIFIGIPLAFVMGLVPLFYIVGHGEINLMLNFIQKAFCGVDVFALLCIPLFMLAGNLMNEFGITESLLGFSQSIIGPVRGGLAYTNVLGSMFFAGITGSALSDTAAIGGIMIPAMIKDGYDPDFSVAVTVASSCIGPIIPPSMSFIIYAYVANVSVGALFLAGFIPGVLMGLAQMVLVFYYSRKRNYPKTPFRSFGFILKQFKKAIWALIMPVIILGGIFSGVFTATEAGAIAVVYAFIIGGLVYRNLSLSQLAKVLRDTAIQASSVMLIIAFAGSFAYVITIEDVALRLGEFLTSLSPNPYIILLFVNAILLFMGTWMDGTAAIILMTPILLPIATNLGINPIHFGIVICINLILGLITPPLGACLFVASSISKLPFERIAIATVPFLLLNISVLFLITYLPDLVLLLPRLFGYI